MTPDWPYDADRDDPLTALRIPVTGFAPLWKYTATFDRESQARPAELEARQLVSFIDEYRQHWFNEHWQAKLARRPFDIDSGTPTKIFHKWAEGDWSYRVVTWRDGSLWVPVFPRLRGTDLDDHPGWAPPMTLVQVMDRTHTVTGGPMQCWLDWKAARPEVFPPDHADRRKD